MHRVDVDCSGWPAHCAGLAVIPYAIPAGVGRSINDDVFFVAPVLFADSFVGANGEAGGMAPFNAALPLVAAGIAALSVLEMSPDASRQPLGSRDDASDILGVAASDAAAVAAILSSLQFVLLYLQRAQASA
jgi:hypothetical protein